MSRELKNPRIKEALLQETVNGKVRCLTCERYCQIAEGEFGFCQTRKNIEGKLYTLVYGDISSCSVNPMEKKPLFHFWPASSALTVGTWSCNFACPWCQNHEISKRPDMLGKGEWMSPEGFMQLMKQYRCQGTSISFNEPTLLFEYSRDVFALAKKEGYFNTLVTNGYMTIEALKILIEEGLDAYVPATSAKALEKARQIGREEGLNYVYVGNLPGHPFENTYCPNCQELLIKRYRLSVSRYNIKDGKCPKCGKGIPIIGR